MLSKPISVDGYRRWAAQGVDGKVLEENRSLLFLTGTYSEAGEFFDIIKKYVFHGAPIDKTELAKEAGDICWYAIQSDNAPGTQVEAEIGAELVRTPGEALKVYVKYSRFGASPRQMAKLALSVCRGYHIGWQEVLQLNMNKLTRRYPDRYKNV